MRGTTKGAGLLAAALLLAQAVASVAWPPSGSDSYAGTTADKVNELLFAAGVFALAAYLVPAAGRLWTTRGDRLAALGCALLGAAKVATVAAGHEVWDAAFVAGLGLCALGWLVAVLAGRALPRALLLAGLVLSLGFYDAAGSAALGLAVAVQLWRAPRAAEEGSGPASLSGQREPSPRGVS